MPVEPNPVKALFLAALDKNTPGERAAFLDDACGGDEDLRQRVEALLHAHGEPDQLLDRPAVALVAAPEAATLALGTSPDQSVVALAPNYSALDQTLAHSHGDGSEADDALALLTPSQEANSLGRLNHYEVLSIVGHGGMGIVLKSRDTKLERIVAVKMLAPQLAASGTARKRFVREAKAAAAVRDEHVIDIHEVNDESAVPYLAMEYIGGITLEDRVKEGGPLELKEILRIGMQTAKGLAAAHAQGLIHRDIKPGNILLENGVQRVKITDFGLARAVDDASLTQSGVIAGTPLYMSPEQARGEAVDHRSDLFSLGSVLYTLATGHPPFRASNTIAVLKRVCEDTPRPIREINPDIPDWLCAIIGKLMAKEPAQRFQSAAEVAELLSQHLAHLQQPQVIPPPPALRTVEPAPRRRRRSPMVLAASALAAALLIATVGGVAYRMWHQDQPVVIIPPPPPPPPPTTSPFDEWKREDIPRALLALAGGGDPELAPTELVAMLGDSRFLLPDTDQMGNLAESPDGKLLAVACGKTVVLFDAKTGEYRKTLTGLMSRVFPVAFSPDGKYLAASCLWDANRFEDHRVRVWSVESGQEFVTFPGHTAPVWSLVFSPDSQRLYSGGSDRLVRVWDLVAKTELVPIQEKQLAVRMALSPNGKLLATGGEDLTVKIWATETGDLQKTLEGHKGSRVAGLAFNPDGTLLATGNEQESFVWKTATWEKWHALSGPGDWLAFSKDDQTLFSASHVARGPDEPHEVHLWNVQTGAKKSYQLTVKSGYGKYCLSGDNRTLYAMRINPAEAMVHCYAAATGKELFPRQGHEGRVNCVAVSPDGQTLASGGEDHTVRLWDLAGWKAGDALPPVRILNGHTESVWSVVFSPDGKTLASGSSDSTIVLWDVASGQEQRTLMGHTRGVGLLAFSPDGQTVAAGEQDGFVRFWEVKTGAEKTPQRLHTGDVRAVAFSPDGKWLASGGADHTVQLVETATGRRHVLRPGTFVTNLAFSRDSQTLFATNDAPNAVLRSWNLQTKKETLLGRTETDNTLCLAVHPAGQLVATASRSGVVRFWDLPSQMSLTLAIEDKPTAIFAKAAAFTPEGRYLVMGNPNGTISIYRTPAPPKPYDPGPPRKLPEPLELAKRPSAADELKRSAIPPELLAKAGGGDPNKAPVELVAVLGGKDGHTNRVLSVAISPDGKLLASTGEDKTVKLWNLATGELRTLKGHTEIVLSLAFSPDGKLLASAGGDQTIKLWEVATGKERPPLTGHTSTVNHVIFSPDGQSLVSAASDSTVRIWDAKTGWLVRTLQTHQSPVWGVTVSPDGKILASAGVDRIVHLWDLATGWELGALQDHTDVVRHVAFHPDGQTLGSCSQDKTIRLWDLTHWRARDTNPPVRTLEGHEQFIVPFAWRADGRLLASGSADGTLRLWDPTQTPARSKVLKLFPPGEPAMHDVAFTPEGRYLATANGDGTVYLLKLAERGEVYEIPPDPVELQSKATLSAHEGAVTWTAFSSDGKTLASAGKDGVLKLWNVAERKERWSIPAHNGGVRVLAVAPDGKTLATAGFDGVIRLWDADGKKLHELPGHKGGVAPLLFTANSEQLLSGGADGCVRFWDVKEGKEVKKIDASKDWITHLSLTPDGKTLATSGNDGMVRLWNVETAKERTALPERSSACFTPDGKRLAVVTPEHQIKLLDAETLEMRAVLSGHTDKPDCLQFSADGTVLASCGADGSIRVWDASHGHLLAVLRGHKGRVWSVALSADGKTLAAGDEDGKLLLWDVSGLSSKPRR